MMMNILINEGAPVVEKQQLFIPSPPHIVWHVLSDISKWPDWQSYVTRSMLMGKVKEGTKFKWRAGGIHFYSQLHTVKINRAIGWTGKTFGAKAIHNWHLEAKDEGTLVHVEESLQGLFPILFKKAFVKKLKEGMKTNLQELSSACANYK